MKLGELIIQYRKDNHLSQREFAGRCHLSNSLISIIEKGINPQTGKTMAQDLETYAKIANAMGISVQELFEKLGNDASVKLYPINIISKDGIHTSVFAPLSQAIKDADTVTARSPISKEQQELMNQLEDLHQNPRLRLLFDRTRKMSPDDVETMLAVAASILKERDD